MEAASAVLIFVYNRRQNLELTFSNFLTYKNLELDFTNYFNHGKNTESFIKADLFPNLSSCTSVSYKPRLILLSSQAFSHTDLFLFSYFFNK